MRLSSVDKRFRQRDVLSLLIRKSTSRCTTAILLEILVISASEKGSIRERVFIFTGMETLKYANHSFVTVSSLYIH